MISSRGNSEELKETRKQIELGNLRKGASLRANVFFSRGCSVATPSHVNIFKEEHRSQVTSDQVHQGTLLWGHFSPFGLPFFKFAFFRVFHIYALYLCHFRPQAHDLFFEVQVNTYIYLKTNPMSPLSVAYMNMCLGLTT